MLRLIQVGDLRNPRGIFALLHEIGHSRDGDPYGDELEQWHDEWRRGAGFLGDKRGNLRELIEKTSNKERNASAEALRMARAIKKETNVDILEVYGSLEELQKVVYACLLSHRRKIESALILREEGVLGFVWKKVKQKLWGGTVGAEQREFMKRTFDRDKLGRKPALERDENLH